MTTNELTTTDHTHLTTGDAIRADQNPALVYLASLSQGSRRVQRSALDTIAALASSQQHDALTFPWSSLRFQHTTAIRSKLAEIYPHATANRILSALRGTLKAAWRLGQMDGDVYQRAVDVANVKGETLPAGRHISRGELAALMQTCGNTPAGIRDAAIIGMLYCCGLRRAELVGLTRADYDAETGALKVRAGAKRKKERLVHVTNGAFDALADWLTIRGDEPGPLFVSIRRGGHIKGSKLTSQAIYKMLRKRAGLAGIKDLSPHDFRRTFVGDLLDAGADISVVQRLAGHANVTTTARYDRRPEDAKRQAASLLHVPYTRRTLPGTEQ